MDTTEIRRLVQTTNLCAALNREIRARIKTAVSFPNDSSALFILGEYARQVSKRWNEQKHGCKAIYEYDKEIYPDTLAQEFCYYGLSAFRILRY